MIKSLATEAHGFKSHGSKHRRETTCKERATRRNILVCFMIAAACLVGVMIAKAGHPMQCARRRLPKEETHPEENRDGVTWKKDNHSWYIKCPKGLRSFDGEPPVDKPAEPKTFKCPGCDTGATNDTEYCRLCRKWFCTNCVKKRGKNNVTMFNTHEGRKREWSAHATCSGCYTGMETFYLQQNEKLNRIQESVRKEKEKTARQKETKERESKERLNAIDTLRKQLENLYTVHREEEEKGSSIIKEETNATDKKLADASKKYDLEQTDLRPLFQELTSIELPLITVA